MSPDDVESIGEKAAPPRYDLAGYEVIDIIRETLGPEGFRAYCVGNVLKYRLRAGKKRNAASDLAKADMYEAWARGDEPRKGGTK